MSKEYISGKKLILLSNSYRDTVIKYHQEHNLLRGRNEVYV